VRHARFWLARGGLGAPGLLGDGGQRAGSVVHVVGGNGIVAVYLGHEEIRELSSVPRAPNTATPAPDAGGGGRDLQSGRNSAARWSSCGSAGPKAAVTRCGGTRHKGATLL
jgi:hypothetical protein